MDAEAIVRALAERDEPTWDVSAGGTQGVYECLVCDARAIDDPAKVIHNPGCPWRLAQEWVKQRDWPMQ